jgi:ABC-2 type transport system ATP-binding protein
MTWGLENVVVEYGGRKALDEVGFEARPASILAIVGGDGAGKTTALKALTGLVKPASGRVRRPPARNIGVVPASSGIYPDLTVAENLEFVARVYGVRNKVAARRTEALLHGARLEDARDRLGGQLSGGMRQKLALSMALLPEPELLILDEATTGIDPVSRAELWRLMARSVAHGTALVLATTYLDEAERAHSLLVLHEGRTLLTGTPQEAIDALPGGVYTSASRPETTASWRRGVRWRAWFPSGSHPSGERVEHDLQDAVVVAALQAGEKEAA